MCGEPCYPSLASINHRKSWCNIFGKMPSPARSFLDELFSEHQPIKGDQRYDSLNSNGFMAAKLKTFFKIQTFFNIKHFAASYVTFINNQLIWRACTTKS